MVRRVHELGAHGRLAAERAAEVADEPFAPDRGVDVDHLAGQRRAIAVDAAVAMRLVLAHAAAQQCLLEGRARWGGAAAQCDRRHGLAYFDMGQGIPSEHDFCASSA